MLHNSPQIPGRYKHGVVLVLVVVCLVLLLAITALAVDGGLLLSRKPFAQATADSAALAAAGIITSGASDGQDSNGKARQAAYDAIETNTEGRSDVTLNQDRVTVRISPQQPIEYSDTITDSDGRLLEGYVEVIVHFRQKRHFSAIFGSTSDLPIRARAVARGRYRRNRDGLIVLEREESRVLHVHGIGGQIRLNVTGEDADIIVNSGVTGSPGAASADGSATVVAPGMTVTGSETASGGGTWNIDSPIVRGAPPTPDPLRDLPEPNPSVLGLATIAGNGRYTATPNGTTVTLQPGVYPSGITLNGNSGPLSVTLSPGIYYLQDGGFSSAGQVNIVGTGVMIYNASPVSTNAGQSNGITISGGSTLSLTGLNSNNANAAIYNGMTIFSARNAGLPITFAGASGTSIRGTIYAPNSRTTVTGAGDAIIGSRYICRTLDVGGTGTLTVQYDPMQHPRDRILQLVE